MAHTEPRTEEVYLWADAIDMAMEARPEPYWTPSLAARKVGLDTHQAAEALQWMAENQFVDASGNGARTRYFRRA